ncbi:hypothetical protein I545_1071 [Mycobacterium kansasii 662]|uniref:Uncharacterized protein n=3 Tax=Mycobacterium kansasii TaxID=1768 RepID=A0A1V3XZ10_MYCKA|nr:hypothetical protein MKAN_24460 [Mycobacterium kansasii ATCC 12478]EUA21959.1 hypothetical protein I545_1071 [Mycobacterium kansasii 662]OOK84288.1 hypothetical protein BZL29_1312 [Mycobacterium kansasii]
MSVITPLQHTAAAVSVGTRLPMFDQPVRRGIRRADRNAAAQRRQADP